MTAIYAVSTNDQSKAISIVDGTDKKLIKCYNCEKVGHVAKDCRATRQGGVKSNMAITCHNCGIMGHKIKDCRVRICSFYKRKGHLEENCWSRQQGTVNREHVNMEWKVKFYNCNKFRHLARSCPEQNRKGSKIKDQVHGNERNLAQSDISRLRIENEELKQRRTDKTRKVGFVGVVQQDKELSKQIEEPSEIQALLNRMFMLLLERSTHEQELKGVLQKLQERKIPEAKRRMVAEALKSKIDSHLLCWPELRKLFIKMGEN